jgi:2'-5' RNA ligase
MRRRRWRTLARRLLRRQRLPQTALIVPVPSAEPAVAKWRARHDPSAALGMPAHVTVLYPFLAPDAITHSVERDLESVLRPYTAFPFRLVGVDRFPGVLYMAPEPAEPFRELTAALHEHWPDHPPYGGDFDSLVPHVTVVQGSEPPEAAPQLEEAAPIEAEATEVWLMAERHHYWALLKRFPLAPPAGH